MGAISLTSVTVFLALGVGTSFRATTTRTAGRAEHRTERVVPLGAFLGSERDGVRRVAEFERWLDSPVDVGRTYLPGDNWDDIEGAAEVLRPWLGWKRANPAKLLVLNVPMLPHNESGVDDEDVSDMLSEGAAGAFDRHFRELARRLTGGGASDAIIVPGWEMNGDTYTSRCAPNPGRWRAYWRRIITTMRAAPGARFRFDFTASRGRDAIPWPHCYPGDDVVDIIGSDNYDQPEGADFDHFIHEPYGLEDQARFATRHKKPMSFPEWGMFHNSDDPDFVKGMHRWITTHTVAYETITDYCPHGVWSCDENPRASAVYRKLFGGRGLPSPAPTAAPAVPGAQTPSTAQPAVPAVPASPAVPPNVATPPVVPGPAVPGPSTQSPLLPPVTNEPPATTKQKPNAPAPAPAKPADPAASAKPPVVPAQPAVPEKAAAPDKASAPAKAAEPDKPAVPAPANRLAPGPGRSDADCTKHPAGTQQGAATPSPEAAAPPKPPGTAVTNVHAVARRVARTRGC